MSARLVLSLALLGAALAGCGAAPFESHSQREIPKGPGLFSGEEGVFAFRSGDTARSSDEEERKWREWKERQQN